MKKSYTYKIGNKTVKRGYLYIPIRYIVAMMITILEVLAIIGIVVGLSIFVPYFYIAVYLTHIACVISIIASEDNPEYKVPWLLVVLVIPVAGFMLYFIFYRRKLSDKFIKRLKKINESGYEFCDEKNFKKLYDYSPTVHSQARLLCNLSGSKLFTDTKIKYFPSGESVLNSMLDDLANAKSFIFMEYFIIEDGEFWDKIHEILVKKAKAGVDVRVVYDDIGCMATLPGNYFKTLKKEGIACVPFSILRGQADSKFNNRSHRKITVIDGVVGYTGGINIADEYINVRKRFGYWKDSAVRLEGSAVYELTKLFIFDFGINEKKLSAIPSKEILYPKIEGEEKGYTIPFGDGPRPLFKYIVAASLIENMIETATESIWITSPYLIIDNTLCLALENAALRGVDVRIVVPHIPDKKIVFEMTKTYYERLMKSGVRIYEYLPGFIHAKSYLADGKRAMIGTVNLDYRSLVHHFENGVWTCETECVLELKEDMEKIFLESHEVKKEEIKNGLFRRFFRAIVRVFAPLL